MIGALIFTAVILGITALAWAIETRWFSKQVADEIKTRELTVSRVFPDPQLEMPEVAFAYHADCTDLQFFTGIEFAEEPDRVFYVPGIYHWDIGRKAKVTFYIKDGEDFDHEVLT